MGNNYLPTDYQTFIHASRYARWLPDEGRRESWIETVSRFSNFMQGHLDKNLGVVIPPEVWRRIEDSIIGLQVMPSMRALMTAGPALERENISGYNCSYAPIDSPRSFDEILYILMNGTGVGFSVEREGVLKVESYLLWSVTILCVKQVKLWLLVVCVGQLLYLCLIYQTRD
jgi:ribonucleoside-triphosphate reductase